MLEIRHLRFPRANALLTGPIPQGRGEDPSARRASHLLLLGLGPRVSASAPPPLALLIPGQPCQLVELVQVHPERALAAATALGQ
jgi:hypothetical protein